MGPSVPSLGVGDGVGADVGGVGVGTGVGFGVGLEVVGGRVGAFVGFSVEASQELDVQFTRASKLQPPLQHTPDSSS